MARRRNRTRRGRSRKAAWQIVVGVGLILLVVAGVIASFVLRPSVVARDSETWCPVPQKSSANTKTGASVVVSNSAMGPASGRIVVDLAGANEKTFLTKELGLLVAHELSRMVRFGG